MRPGLFDSHPSGFYARALGVGALGAVFLAAALAAPEERPVSSDAILQLLQDKGLVQGEVASDNPKWVRQVRRSASERV
ncbi:MAG: hypothetical protein RI949_3267 [Pseudomonadota bacterium]